MAGFVKRALARLLGLGHLGGEEIRYIDFVEPVPPTVGRTSPTHGDTPLPDEAPLPAVEEASKGGDLPTGSTSAIVNIDRADLPPVAVERQALHPDEDWFTTIADMPSAGEVCEPVGGAVKEIGEWTWSESGVIPAPGDEPEQAESSKPVEVVETAEPQLLLSQGTLDTELISLIENEESEIDVDEENEDDVKEDDDNSPVSLDGEWLFELDISDSVLESNAKDDEWWLKQSKSQTTSSFSTQRTLHEKQTWRASSRAAALVNELDLYREIDRRHALRWLEDLLAEFPHGASHAAISRLILGGISFMNCKAWHRSFAFGAPTLISGLYGVGDGHGR